METPIILGGIYLLNNAILAYIGYKFKKNHKKKMTRLSQDLQNANQNLSNLSSQVNLISNSKTSSEPISAGSDITQ